MTPEKQNEATTGFGSGRWLDGESTTTKMKNQHCENCGVHKDMHAGVGCKTFVQPKETKTAKELFDAAFSGVRTLRSPEYKLGVISHLEYKIGEKSECKCPYPEGSVGHDAFWSGVTESWLIIEKSETVAEPSNEKS